MTDNSLEVVYFVQHSYEKVSVVEFGCLVKQFLWCVFFALDYAGTVIVLVNT